MEQAQTKPGKLAEFRAMPVNPKVREHLSSLMLGKQRLRRQTKEEYGKQRDLSAAGEKQGFETSIYFRPGGVKKIAEASREQQFPAEGVPEVCFAGRSNVGKSSLLNSVAGGLPLSRTSSKPGETTTLRWFSSSNLINFVDLPGYGFSFADQGRSAVWMQMVKEYLTKRKSLKRCFVLIDARQPIKPSDESTMRFLEEVGATFQVILTKSDLVTIDDLAKRVQLVSQTIKDRFPKAIPEVIAVSAKNRAGLAVLRKRLISLFNPEQKLIFEAERDKKWAKAEKRRERRATEADQLKELQLHKQRVHSRRAFVRHIKSDRKAAEL